MIPVVWRLSSTSYQGQAGRKTYLHMQGVWLPLECLCKLVYSSEWDLDPTVAPMMRVLEFLKSILLDKSTNMQKGYISDISSRHVQIDKSPFGSHPAVSQWLKRLSQSKGISRSIILAWDFDLILSVLKSHPFEPAAEDKFTTWKTVFLVAIAST